MARRVRPGEKLNITAAEYNRLLAAADAIARDRLSGGGGSRTHVRDAATVRVHYQSATTVPIGGIVGFNAPLGDPDVDNTALARFVRDATIQSVRPIADEHTGRFGVAIEPIAEDKVGRVVFAGVVAARVNVLETWHHYADVSNSGGTTLQSKPNGSAQILWRRDANQTGVQWAVVRVGKPADPAFLVKVPSGGIPGRSGLLSLRRSFSSAIKRVARLACAAVRSSTLANLVLLPCCMARIGPCSPTLKRWGLSLRRLVATPPNSCKFQMRPAISFTGPIATTVRLLVTS
jgi:hypothetical protein